MFSVNYQGETGTQGASEWVSERGKLLEGGHGHDRQARREKLRTRGKLTGNYGRIIISKMFLSQRRLLRPRPRRRRRLLLLPLRRRRRRPRPGRGDRRGPDREYWVNNYLPLENTNLLLFFSFHLLRFVISPLSCANQLETDLHRVGHRPQDGQDQVRKNDGKQTRQI